MSLGKLGGSCQNPSLKIRRKVPECHHFWKSQSFTVALESNSLLPLFYSLSGTLFLKNKVHKKIVMGRLGGLVG